MQRITAAQIEEMRSRGFDRSTIAEAEAWLVKCQEADALIDEITVAFADVQLEDGIGLRESNGIDDCVGPDELKRLRALDDKHDWRKISAELLNYCHAASSFLDAKGVHFHLPAFLTAELRGEYVNGTGMIETLIWNSFTARDYLKLLTADQKAVLVKSLEFAKAHPGWKDRGNDIDRAIARFQ